MLETTNDGNGKEKHYIMENSVYAPSQVLERIMQAGEKRILLPVVRCILLGMPAGIFATHNSDYVTKFIIHREKKISKR